MFEGSRSAEAAAAGRLTPSARRLVVSLIVACAMFMQNLDSTIIATALPTIADALHETALRLNVAITCYLLSLAVFIPISGWTADRFGARRVFSAAVVVFTLGSIACGLSQSLWMLVLSRIVQGMGGAMMVPVGRLVLLRTVPKSELVRAMSWVSVPALIGPVIGPPLGGFIVTYASWRWIFFINIPIGVLGVLLVNLFVENTREAAGRPFDLSGFALTGVGLASLAFAFEAGGRGALSWPTTLGLVLGGGLCLFLYGRHARRVDHPIIDLSLMRIPTYAMTTIGGFLFRMGLGALPFLMPLMLQVGFGLSPLSSGLITFASACGALSNKLCVTPIIRALGFRRVLIGNTIVSATFLFGYSFFRPTTPHALIFAALLAGGFFRSLQMTSLNTLSYADVPAALLSRATSLTSMAQQLAQSVGVGTGALILYVMLSMHGRAVSSPADFSFALAVVGAISMVSVPFFLRMAPDAGAEVSGRAAPRASAD
ncbi:MAG TPA: DHA2 family efflux MFS transporter permease subunit [Stellaceae bacterium]|nr:DHA2 family efflux MFS transporter permease subunit [Stellaceae bacterium]